MLEFQSVRYKNFMSVGDDFIEVPLNKSPTTVVYGANGSGKTTIMEALVYGLYGKPYRKFKLSKLVNSINRKNSLVEVDFQKNGTQYRIRRGQKPAKFEIYKDGFDKENMIAIDGSNSDYQKKLEDILGMDFKIFTQIVFLSNKRFVPFMELTTPDRRKVVEDLFDMAIFGDMKELLKGKRSDLKLKKQEIESLLMRSDADVATYTGIINNANTQIESQILAKESDIDMKKAELNNIQKEHDSHKISYSPQETFNVDRSRIDKINELFSGINSNISLAESKLNDLDNGICKVDTEFQERYETVIQESYSLKSELNAFKFETFRSDDIDSKITEFKDKIRDLEREKSNLQNESDVCHACERPFDDAESRKEYREKRIQEINEEIDSHNDELVSLNETKHAEFENKKAEMETSLDTVNQSKEKLDQEKQSIINQQCEEVQAELEKNKSALIQLQEKKKVAEEEVVEIERKNKAITENNQKYEKTLQEFVYKMNSINDIISSYERDIESLKNNNTNVDEERKKLEEAESKSKEYNETLDKLAGVEQVFSVTDELLADDAIKSNIISQYIPIINDKLNKLLTDMNLPVGFILDENFNETVMASSKDGFVYESFSNGQQGRINLAIVLVWIEIAKMKNSVNTNLLFLDEVFDGTLDEAGIDDFMRLVSLNYSHLNMFVITQRAEMMMDKFRNSIEYKLNNGFTEKV